MEPHDFMRQLLQSLRVRPVDLARQTGIDRVTVKRILDGKTLGKPANRQALTRWGAERGLLREGEEWWTGMYRACEEQAVARSVGRIVGAGLDRCPSCGAKLDGTEAT